MREIEHTATLRAVGRGGVALTRRGQVLCLAINAKLYGKQVRSQTFVWKGKSSAIARAVEERFWWWLERMPEVEPAHVLRHAADQHAAALSTARHRTHGRRLRRFGSAA